MKSFIVLLLIFWRFDCLSIPYINNVYLQPIGISNWTLTKRLNISCEQCLCEQFTVSYLALNCFANNSCEFFSNFPKSYKLISSNESRIYFLQNQYPNESLCCMPNVTELLLRLQNASPIALNLSFAPSGLGYDPNYPSEAAVVGWWSSPASLWFNPITMTAIENNSLSTSLTVTLYNNEMFTAVDGTPRIHLRNKLTNVYIGNLTYSTLNQVRKIIFINDGQTMIVPTQQNKSVTIFNFYSSSNYSIQGVFALPYSSIHGIAKVNETFFYISTWSDRLILSCKYENLTWTHQILVNGTTTQWGSHLTVDDCGRIWFINTNFGLRIFDSNGLEIGNWNLSLNSTNRIYDLVFLSNYVLLISFIDQHKILRFDPFVSC
ncbi:unnamed protein product [Adineta ricciae]|uniref:Uncharacterized protein n=1 Tax=Adineta ricciae TaxID=249248 RepID=A0A815VDM4_ADIRI|nr:unnamed protein product [Adineta ricciae]CAF1529179.1 unnamed protein product [Adineta ricciae]